jgi:hypothetical protein
MNKQAKINWQEEKQCFIFGDVFDACCITVNSGGGICGNKKFHL